MLYRLCSLIYPLLFCWSTLLPTASAASSTPFIPFDTAGVLSTVLTHVVLLQRGDITSIYYELSTDGFRSATTQATLAEYTAALPPIADERQVSLETLTFGGVAALYQGRLLNQQGKSLFWLNYLLRYENGSWRVDAFQMTPYSPPTAKQPKQKIPRLRPYLRDS